ncbi:MAG: hypothetical protein ACLRM8_07520 [Alistipes sp.]
MPRTSRFRADEILDALHGALLSAPSRASRGNGHTKVLCQIDNVEPHERHLTDKPFNRYYLRAVDGFVYMSEQVHCELEAYSEAPALFRRIRFSRTSGSGSPATRLVYGWGWIRRSITCFSSG